MLWFKLTKRLKWLHDIFPPPQILTYSIMLLVSHFLLLSLQCKHNCKQSNKVFRTRPDGAHSEHTSLFAAHLVVESAVLPLQKFLYRSSCLEANSNIRSYLTSPWMSYWFQFTDEYLTLLLRQMTGHKLKPNVQQQQRQPHRSHRTFTGSVFLRQLFTRLMLALNSSGATWGNEHTQLTRCNTWCYSAAQQTKHSPFPWALKETLTRICY